MRSGLKPLVTRLRNSALYNAADVREAADLIEELAPKEEQANWYFLNRLDRQLQAALFTFIEQESGFLSSWARTIQNDDPLHESIVVESPRIRMRVSVTIEKNELL